MFLFNDGGDCEAARLRPGNVHSSDDWDELLVPEIERQHANGRRVAVRADAAFAKPEIYEALETRGVDFVRRDGRALDQGRQTGGPLDCHRFRANEVRLQLSVLAYNLGNLRRRLALPSTSIAGR